MRLLNSSYTVSYLLCTALTALWGSIKTTKARTDILKHHSRQCRAVTAPQSVTYRHSSANLISVSITLTSWSLTKLLTELFWLFSFQSKPHLPANFTIPAIQKTLVGRLQSVFGTSTRTPSAISPQQVPMGACQGRG